MSDTRKAKVQLFLMIAALAALFYLVMVYLFPRNEALEHFPEGIINPLPVELSDAFLTDNKDLTMCVRFAGTGYSIFLPQDASVEKDIVKGTYEGVPYRISMADGDFTGPDDSKESMDAYQSLFDNSVWSVPFTKVTGSLEHICGGYLGKYEAYHSIHRFTAKVSIRTQGFYLVSYTVKTGARTAIICVVCDSDNLEQGTLFLNQICSSIRSYEDGFDGVVDEMDKSAGKTGSSVAISEPESEELSVKEDDNATQGTLKNEAMDGFHPSDISYQTGHVGSILVQENIMIDLNLEFGVLLIAWDDDKLPANVSVFNPDGVEIAYSPEFSTPEYLCYKIYNVTPGLYKVRGSSDEQLSRAFVEVYDAEEFYDLFDHVE